MVLPGRSAISYPPFEPGLRPAFRYVPASLGPREAPRRCRSDRSPGTVALSLSELMARTACPREVGHDDNNLGGGT